MMRHLLVVVVAVLVGAPWLHAGGEFQYVGVKKCKTCHKKEKIGDQYGKWKEMKHSKAFESLLTEEAKEAAAEMGIEDPTKSEKCLKCHTTGYGEGGYDLSKSAEENARFEGVQCEACHGPGSGYKKKKIMKALARGEIKPEEVGMVVPTEEVCLNCHGKGKGNPFEEEFNFEEAKEKIAHPVPSA